MATTKDKYSATTRTFGTCELLRSAAQCADVTQQTFNPQEGDLLCLEHVSGCTAAAALALKSTVAVPCGAGQRFLQLDWRRTEGRWERNVTDECDVGLFETVNIS